MAKAKKRPLPLRILRRLAYFPAVGIDYALRPAVNKSQKVLINGFWRSGTTWVQEVVAEAYDAKTIFEPLCSVAKPPYLNRRMSGEYSDVVHYEPYMPLSVNEFNNRDWDYLRNCLCGASVPVFNYSNRRNIISFKKRAVVKTIRSPFILGDIIKKFDNLKAVHITRHPCAVVASFQNADWRWNFEDLKFKDIFPDLETLPEDVKKDAETLISFDNRKAHEKIAAYWAITEKYAAKAVSTGKCLSVQYELLVINEESEFNKIFEFLNITPAKDLKLSRSSIVTVQGRENVSKLDRTLSWQKRLDKTTQEDVQRIALDLWPDSKKYLEFDKMLGADINEDAETRRTVLG